MKLSAAEKRAFRRALRIAIDYDETLIDAYRVAWSKRPGMPKKVLSPEGRKIATRCRRNIAASRNLLSRLDGDVDRT